MTISLAPSNLFVRAIYCVSLIFATFSLLRIFGVFNFGRGGDMLIIAAMLEGAALAAVVLSFVVGNGAPF